MAARARPVGAQEAAHVAGSRPLREQYSGHVTKVAVRVYALEIEQLYIVLVCFAVYCTPLVVQSVECRLTSSWVK